MSAYYMAQQPGGSNPAAAMAAMQQGVPGLKAQDLFTAATAGRTVAKEEQTEEVRRGVSAALNLRNAVNSAATPQLRDSANQQLEKILLNPQVRQEYNTITQGEQTAAIRQEENLRGRSVESRQENAETRAQELHTAAVRKAEAEADKAVRAAQGKGEATWLDTVPPAAWQSPEGLEQIKLAALQNGDGTMFQRVSELQEQGVAAQRGVDMGTVSASLNAANPNFKPSLEDRRNAEVLMAQAGMAAEGPAGLRALQERFVASFAPATASRALAEMQNLRGSTDFGNRIGNMFTTMFDGRSTLKTQEEYREIAKFMRDFANYEISKTIDAVEAGGGTDNIGVAETARKVYGVLEDNMFTEDPVVADARRQAQEDAQFIQAQKMLRRGGP
jgi:hypothetical protein